MKRPKGFAESDAQQHESLEQSAQERESQLPAGEETADYPAAETHEDHHPAWGARIARFVRRSPQGDAEDIVTQDPDSEEEQEAENGPEPENEFAETIELFTGETGNDRQETQELIPARSTGFLDKFSRKQPKAEGFVAAEKAYKQAQRERRKRERHERKRFTWAQRMRRRNALIALSAVSLLVLTVIVGVFTPLMSVQTIEVRGTDRVAPDEITQALTGVIGTPLALVDDEQVGTALGSLELLQSFEVDKIPPHTLRVVVRERQPVVAIPQGESVRLIDPAGIEVATVDKGERPEGIPVTKGIGEDFTSETFISISQAIIRIPEQMRNMLREVSAETPQQIVFVLEQGIPVLWGDADDSVKKAFVLQAMLEALGDTPVKSIDVSSPEAPVFIPG